MQLARKVEIGVACVLIPPLLELLPASRVLGWIDRVPARRRGGAVPPAQLARHVDRLLALAPLVWRYTCLRRATVLTVLLRRQGRDARTVIGVRRREGGGVEAHAWIRSDGEEPFLEPADVGEFARLERPGARGEPASRAAPPQ